LASPFTPSQSFRLPSQGELLKERRLDPFLFLIRLVGAGGGVHLGSLGTSSTNWPIVPAPGDYEDGEFGGMMIGKGIRYSKKTCPSATVSTTKPT
jgi:hypothetical protein